jgi:hypothetical protein
VSYSSTLRDSEAPLTTKLVRQCLSIVLVGVLSVFTFPRVAMAYTCPGTHGEYTDALCFGDHMVGNGSYMASGNGSYRMVLGGGLYVYDYSDYYNPSYLYTVYDPALNGAAYEVALDDNYEGFSLVFYDDHSNVLDFSSGGSYTYTNYVKIENDGCVRFYGPSDEQRMGVQGAYGWGCH